MDGLTLGVLGESGKENEHRLPIHPRHVERIDADLRERILLEHGYGDHFDLPDDHLTPLVAGMRTRREIIAESDVVLLPKPTLPDVTELRDGQVLWGWPHCVQDAELTQLAIDKRLTLIAWEEMNHWTGDGRFLVHVFHINNEMAGYASVLHAMALDGLTGHYGHHLRAVVIGFGNTARGAVTGLHALGVHEVTALTMRDVTAVASPIPSVVLGHQQRTAGDPSRTEVVTREGVVPVHEFLARHDLVVNCVLQDTDSPLMFVVGDEVERFPPGSLIVDVSCDEGMGFDFARPTAFEDPVFTVGDGVRYYGVDHSPSYLWNSATWEISEALLPHVRTVLAGPDAWDADRTIRQAIEIRAGVVQNPRILSFQRRAAEYPHERR
ncbi:MAG TPA: N(5)-(carboxyethyl)ornithine synthase [Jiangellales bacterium]|nr:N(5)-(carboxyethyl)ornithine synthase [Jiangellales bacterium]